MIFKIQNPKSKLTLYGLTLCLLLFTFQTAVAQDSLTLTLDRAIQSGLENSNRLKQSRAKANAASAQAKSASTAKFPTVIGNASYTRLSDIPDFNIHVPFPEPNGSDFAISEPILNNWNFKVGVEQPLFTAGKLKSGIEAQRALANSEEMNFATDRRELVYNINEAYWQLYKAGEFLKVINETVALVEVHLKDVRNLQEQGMATNSEVLAVQVQHSDTRLIQIKAADNVRIARIHLNNLIGLQLSTMTVVSSVPDTSSELTPGDADEFVDLAMARRSELQAVELSILASKASVRAARADWFPQIAAFGNFYYSNPNQRIQPPVDEFNDTWDVGIGASWSLWNWGDTKYRTQKARADLARAEYALAEAKDGIEAQVTADYLNLLEAKERISVASEGAILAQENYRVMREKFRNGFAPNSDLLDAENNLMKARWNSTQAQVDFALAKARLAKSTGQDTTE